MMVKFLRYCIFASRVPTHAKVVTFRLISTLGVSHVVRNSVSLFLELHNKKVLVASVQITTSKNNNKLSGLHSWLVAGEIHSLSSCVLSLLTISEITSGSLLTVGCMEQ